MSDSNKNERKPELAYFSDRVSKYRHLQKMNYERAELHRQELDAKTYEERDVLISQREALEKYISKLHDRIGEDEHGLCGIIAEFARLEDRVEELEAKGFWKKVSRFIFRFIP